MSTESKRKLEEAKESIESAKEVLNEASTGSEVTFIEGNKIDEVARPDLEHALMVAIEEDIPELEEKVAAAKELLDGVNGNRMTKIAASREMGNLRLAEGQIEEALDELEEVGIK